MNPGDLSMPGSFEQIGRACQEGSRPGGFLWQIPQGHRHSNSPGTTRSRRISGYLADDKETGSPGCSAAGCLRILRIVTAYREGEAGFF
jgi:hypothetical protein